MTSEQESGPPARIVAPRLLLLAVVARIAFAGVGAPATGARWIGTWATAPQSFLPGSLKTFRNQTLRLIVHTSIGATRLRIRLSNTYGDRPLIFGSAHVARRTAGPDVDPTSDRILTFGGKSTVTVPKGTTIASDAVQLAVPALSDLAVSLYLPDETPATTDHLLALQASYVSPETGDSTGLAKFVAAKKIGSWPFLTGVDVDPPPGGAAIVAFGDSWFDGDGSTADANHRLGDFLAERLQRDARGRRFAVLNEGLIGNRLLRDSPREPPSPFGDALGESGLKRFERDALGQPGVRVVLLRFGVNDLGFPGALAPAAESVTAADLIRGYRSLVASARRRGLRVIATTIAPFENAATAPGYYTPEKEAVRREFNEWMRSSRDFDGVVDLDRLLRDPDHATRLLPAYDSGDHLHPNDAGYAAAANAIPLPMLGIR
ncbi:MAG: SGNH/GDSL hydrolase family protein [Acidobacteriota bacterium]